MNQFIFDEDQEMDDVKKPNNTNRLIGQHFCDYLISRQVDIESLTTEKLINDGYLKKLESTLGYSFKDKSLLLQAVTNISFKLPG